MRVSLLANDDHLDAPFILVGLLLATRHRSDSATVVLSDD